MISAGDKYMGYDLNPLFDAIISDNPSDMLDAIADLRENIGELESRQVPDAVEALVSLFYIDLGDKPQFVKVVEDAVSAIAEIGEGAIPTLMWLLQETDTKANLMMARALGRIGPPAYGSLKDLFYNGITAWQKIMALFALAKMHEAALMEIFPDVVTSLDDSDRELRDTAARTVGRIISSFQPGQLPRDSVDQAFNKLLHHLGDNSSVVRAKCVRALGKLGKFKYLLPQQRELAYEAVSGLLGVGESGPDPLFLVRKEAEQALVWLKGEVE